ncbi:hypothetical protein BJX65DRAFT_269032, partial [Aspergillus insuetus]
MYNEAAEAEEHRQDENAWGSGAIWLAAGLEKLSRLQDLQRRNHGREFLPCVGWTVIGH